MAEFNLKVYRIFEKYRNKLKADLKTVPKGEGAGRGANTRVQTIRGNRSKNRILDFFLKNGRWPNRVSDSKTERQLGTRFENFIAKTAAAYDPTLRRIARALGRGTNNKRPHNVAAFKKEILTFIKENGSVPTTRSGEKIPGEGQLRNKLDYYTKNANDMTLLGMVYKEDPCHRSGIPMKYRPLLNQQLDVTKPLFRLVK
jgi:hypothetical protein